MTPIPSNKQAESAVTIFQALLPEYVASVRELARHARTVGDAALVARGMIGADQFHEWAVTRFPQVEFSKLSDWMEYAQECATEEEHDRNFAA